MIEDLYMKYRETTFSANNNYEAILGKYNPSYNYIMIDKMLSQYFKFMFSPLTKNFLDVLENKKIIDFDENGANVIEKTNQSLLLAYATFLHETYHSWQFYGSSLGFMNIMGIAAQGSLGGILRFVDDNLVKPLYKHEEAKEINHIVNTFFDIEFGASLLFYPKKSEEVFKSPFFESTAHSYRYLYQESLRILEKTFEFKEEKISYYNKWECEFKKLNDRKENLFFHGSPLLYNEFGAFEIIEGQARFQELQYLYTMDNKFFDWNLFRKYKFLEEPYITVFNFFLKYLNLDYPKTPISKEVNIFLLICDIALNPNIGYPNEIVNYKKFVTDINPYCRFIDCLKVLKANTHIINFVEEISPEAYIYVSEFITSELNYISLRTFYREIIKLSNSIQNIEELKEKYKNFDYKKDNSKNILVEYYFMHHLDIIENKYVHPEFFCWTGQYITGKFEKYTDKKIGEIMEKISPPFLSLGVDDKIGLYSIYESRKGYEEFSSYFFDFQTFNDLIRQLILKPGEFRYNYLWNNYSSENEFKAKFNEKFRMNTNRDFEDFTII